MCDVFVAINRIHAKDSAAVVKKALVLRGSSGGRIHVAHVMDNPADSASLAQAKTALQETFGPLFGSRPDVPVTYHVLQVDHCTSPYAEPAALKAKAFAAISAAQANNCSVIIIGGRSRRVRDSALPAFLMGHSLEHWLRTCSPLPVVFAGEGQITYPVDMDKSIRGMLPSALVSQPVPASA